MEWDLHEAQVIQLELDQQTVIKNIKMACQMESAKGSSRKPLVRHVKAEKKQMRKFMATIPLDPFQMETGHTIPLAELSKQMDREERAYQKVFLNSLCGQGKMLSSSTHIWMLSKMCETHIEMMTEKCTIRLTFSLSLRMIVIHVHC